jgi:hypothetical protein
VLHKYALSQATKYDLYKVLHKYTVPQATKYDLYKVLHKYALPQATGELTKTSNKYTFSLTLIVCLLNVINVYYYVWGSENSERLWENLGKRLIDVLF